MSEMLANHYFLVRNFPLAKPIFEGIVAKDSANKLAAKKLIICYVTSGEIDKALSLFLSLIKSDIDFIINTNVKADDCPCPDLISEIENQNNFFRNEVDKLVALGILWLYCSIEISKEYFKKAEAIDPAEAHYKEIYSLLLKRINNKKPKSIN
jgi:pentatricopeptide repeat protein